ncbi:hypothetical protein FB45DRAFT_902565 [Roridomyces roridus]|uniref:MFS general substrate transporter n=1 Tax=Roridomyces roridus TaxID=1738132 RepID=A0AAD7C3T4_9AGAR|nr:hypothetical protein FB45DRAFT_902565 [Roridomyces roridus]
MSRSNSWVPQAEDSLIVPSRSRSAVHGRRDLSDSEDSVSGAHGERNPLLSHPVPRKKPFYRARPLWLAGYAIVAALVRAMTLAPRVEVFTQLACLQLHQHHNHTLFDGMPPSFCLSDPAVSANAARIQTTYTTTMGLLSACTTAWWGQFGERYGRTRVLAFATLGLFLTDIVFIIASSPSSPLYSYSHTLVLIAPVVEGLLGGWSSTQSAASAYISDCTSSGSRASVFSRFTGVSFLGFSLGPIISTFIIQHPISFLRGQGMSVTPVFWVAATGSFINLFLAFFVFPESLSRDKQRASRASYANTELRSFLRGFFGPLSVFLPATIAVEGSTRKRKDWSLTILAGVLLTYFLSAGIYQIKYLYAKQVYTWDVERISYYIAFMGGGRALHLLFILPLVISVFKPKSPKNPIGPGGIKLKPKPTKEHLSREIKFDIRLTRISLVIDVLSNAAILLAPAPVHTQLQQLLSDSGDTQVRNSQVLFVVASWVSCWGTGLVPAAHSLALCITQARKLIEEEDGQTASTDADSGAGALFGALAMLQAIGQMILGPLIFGVVFYGTVATHPKAIFALAGAILLLACVSTVFVHSPLAGGKSRAHVVLPVDEEQERRGRSRASKNVGYGSVGENTNAQASSSSSGSS